jgi:hypothetical protein
MNATSFHTAFPDKKPRKFKDLQDCIADSGDRVRVNFLNGPIHKRGKVNSPSKFNQ